MSTSFAANVGSYENYEQDHDYQWDSGIAVVPRASRTPGHRRIRLHGGVGLRVVKWAGTKNGKPPMIPTHGDTINDRMLSSSVHAQLPKHLPQAGAYQFTISGEYVYVQNEPRLAGLNALPTGSYPFPTEPQDTFSSQVVAPVLKNYGPILQPEDPEADPPTLAVFDAAMSSAFNAVSRAGATTWVWPMTVIPSQFSTTAIAG